MKNPSESHVSSPPAPSNKAYPVLLAISLCLSAVLCWMYVTKPVIVAASTDEAGVASDSSLDSTGAAAASTKGEKSVGKRAQSELVPSDSGLPGSRASGSKRVSSSASKPIDPLKLMASGNGTGWETTNARVQHILRADSGNGELTNIVLNVPVLYQTRTMRWTPGDVANARLILTRLMVYEGNLSKVKLEGEALLVDWNRLLEKTVPSSALRADSPSIPYNRSQGTSGQTLPGDEAIKVE